MAVTNHILDDLRRIETQRNQQGNWIERFINSMTSRKNREQAMVHPCVIDGQKTLVYERGLKKKDQAAFNMVTEFATTHGYRLKEDQRADFLEGIKRVKNNRRANAISVLVLTAGLMSQTAQAESAIEKQGELSYIDPDITHTQTEAGFDFDFDSFNTQEELVSGLLGWINSHSTFQYDIDNIPSIKKVDAKQIAEVAFGGELPAAIDAESLNIFGLYNFNEKTVYLLDTIDLETQEGKGILLHELVHYLQYQTGIDQNAKCKNELESLAYVLEAKFLESQHHEHNITASHINKVSQCRV